MKYFHNKLMEWYRLFWDMCDHLWRAITKNSVKDTSYFVSIGCIMNANQDIY